MKHQSECPNSGEVRRHSSLSGDDNKGTSILSLLLDDGTMVFIMNDLQEADSHATANPASEDAVTVAPHDETPLKDTTLATTTTTTTTTITVVVPEASFPNASPSTGMDTWIQEQRSPKRDRKSLLLAVAPEYRQIVSVTRRPLRYPQQLEGSPMRGPTDDGQREEKRAPMPSNTTETSAVEDPVTTSENVALNVNEYPSLKPALTAEIPSRDSEFPTKKRPLEDIEKHVDEDSSCETPVASKPKPSPEDLLEGEKGDEMQVDVAPTSAQGIIPPRPDSDASGSDLSQTCDPEPEVTAARTASSAQPKQCQQYEEVSSKQPADSEAQHRAEGGNKQASPPRQQDNTTDNTPEPNIDDSQATAVAPDGHRRRLRPKPGLAVTRHAAKATPEKKDIKKKNIKYEVIRVYTDEEKDKDHSDL
ncbi:uncharacterized protein LOC126471315 [Schistocerca serialis cubense]|uniref:uncharacterized protein LOC126471315 n=1 Tax=Schistocerca serialis cubense TaxID=2023355 RepID=UPI00214E66D6|nr:uncharacterized protein LOC126471315 [Schistocerca serialis cubense]